MERFLRRKKADGDTIAKNDSASVTQPSNAETGSGIRTDGASSGIRQVGMSDNLSDCVTGASRACGSTDDPGSSPSARQAPKRSVTLGHSSYVNHTSCGGDAEVSVHPKDFEDMSDDSDAQT